MDYTWILLIWHVVGVLDMTTWLKLCKDMYMDEFY